MSGRRWISTQPGKKVGHLSGGRSMSVGSLVANVLFSQNCIGFARVQVARWFADRSDMILILFDAHRLDVSAELMEVREEGSEQEWKLGRYSEFTQRGECLLHRMVLGFGIDVHRSPTLAYCFEHRTESLFWRDVYLQVCFFECRTRLRRKVAIFARFLVSSRAPWLCKTCRDRATEVFFAQSLSWLTTTVAVQYGPAGKKNFFGPRPETLTSGRRVS